MATSNIASVAPAAETNTNSSLAENGDHSDAEKVDDGKGGGLEENPIAPEVLSTGADGKIRAHTGDTSADGKIQALAGSADDKSEESNSPARVMISKILTPARAAFALFTTLALWSTADRPERAVWAFSLIACSYVALWTIYLTAAIRARTVLVTVSYLALLASAITHLSAAAGILVILLDAAYAAALLGYALAENRQRKGAERAADEVLARAGEEEPKDKEARYAAFAMFSFYSGVISLGSAAFAAWLVLRYSGDTYWLVVGLSLLIHLAVFCWTCLVTLNKLRGALVAPELTAVMYWFNIILFLPDFLLTYLFGNTIGMLVHPLGVMALTGLLGYSLGVYARYEHLERGSLEAKKID